MTHSFPAVLFPIHRLFSGRHILPHYRAALSNQWRSLSELVDLQERRLGQLLTHAGRQVPFYRDRFSRAGLRPTEKFRPQDLAQIPVLTKSDIRNHGDDLLASNYRRNDLLARSTGGSTGVPTSFYYDRRSWDSRVGAKYAAYTWAGWTPGTRTAVLAGSPIDREIFTSLRGRLKSFLFNELVLDSFTMNLGQRRNFIGRLKRFRPRVLIGYTSACLALAEQVLRDDRPLTIPVIIVSAEMLFPQQRRLIQRAFQGEVFDLYGSREAAAIGMECRQHAGFHLAIDRYVIEILRDDQPVSRGEEGEIVITDLLNYGMPFIRYKIGDVGKLLSRDCPCGRQGPLLKLTRGRITDIIITADGRPLPGEFFPHLFKEVSSYVERFQVVQERIDHLTVHIVPAPSYGAQQTDYLRKRIQEKVGAAVDIEFRMTDAIAPERSGKHRVTKSRLKEKEDR